MKETNAPRFFVEPAHIGNDLVRITGPDVIHITRVLRLRRGSIVVLLDGKGKSYEAEIQSPGRNEVFCRIKKELLTAPVCPVQVTLVQGIPKAAYSAHRDCRHGGFSNGPLPVGGSRRGN